MDGAAVTGCRVAVVVMGWITGSKDACRVCGHGAARLQPGVARRVRNGWTSVRTDSDSDFLGAAHRCIVPAGVRDGRGVSHAKGDRSFMTALPRRRRTAVALRVVFQVLSTEVRRELTPRAVFATPGGAVLAWPRGVDRTAVTLRNGANRFAADVAAGRSQVAVTRPGVDVLLAGVTGGWGLAVTLCARAAPTGPATPPGVWPARQRGQPPAVPAFTRRAGSAVTPASLATVTRATRLDARA